MRSWSERSRRYIVVLAVTALVVTVIATTFAAAATTGGHGGGRHRSAPPRLGETGLYSDLASRRIDPRNLHYVPQYPLWSDGAGKQRWIYLPPRTAIDARDPEKWGFPIGTKLWKEFGWGRPVETRYIERTRDGWIFASYVWNADGTDAVLASQDGLLSSYEVAPGRRHPIPSVADCLNCHQNGRSIVLGFSTLQLSSDRDPLAPNAEALTADAVTLDTLVARDLVRGLPKRLVATPPRILASTPRERAALGYLHANCGNCHDSKSTLGGLDLELRHDLTARDRAHEPAIGAVGHESRFRPRGAPPGPSFWIAPGDPRRSTVLVRIASRSPAVQMPPLGTQLVDHQAVALLSAWIEQDLRSSNGATQQR